MTVYDCIPYLSQMTGGKPDAIRPVLIEEMHKLHFSVKVCWFLNYYQKVFSIDSYPLCSLYAIIQLNKSILVENDSVKGSLYTASIPLICTIFAD